MLTLDQLIFDPSSNSGAKVGAHIVDADGHFLQINADGSINANLSATDLDIRNLVFATDKVDVTGSVVALDSASLAALENITVSVSSTVEIANDTGNPIPVNGTVALDSGSLAALESITVQNGAGAAAVNIQDGGNSITVDANNLDIRDLVFATDKVDTSGSRVIDNCQSLSNSNISVTTTAALLTPSALANRKLILIQNLGSRDIFVGSSTVTTANGVRISAGANAELPFGPTAQLYARTATGTADVRIIEAAQ